jgi:hypothetical protein
MSTYEVNRAKYPLAELQKLAGQWVAFSLDGSRVLASAETLVALENQLARLGVDAEQAALERIELTDSALGGAEIL